MNNYKVLQQQSYQQAEYQLVPIRHQDRYEIMRWRNEQMYHLRQSEPLTEADQDSYFDEVVSQLFDQEQPEQILFSFLEGERCIGYGGLVHINWRDRNAEVSFVMDTKLEHEGFEKYWTLYLGLLEFAAFNDLDFHKLYVYAFDLRPHLYEALEVNDYFLDARLKDHCLFEGNFKDVVIYSKIV